MDNDKKLFEELLKADGIEPKGVSDAERAVFRKMLDNEQKHMKRLSWKYVGVVWIFVLAMLGVCVSENILEALHIPFVIACLVVVGTMLIARVRYEPGYSKKMMESNRKISKLYYLVHGRHRGLVLVGKRDGKRHIRWLRVIMIAAGLWVVMSLGGAGVFYLLCQRWIYASGDMLHIFYCTLFSLSFVGFILYSGLKTPLGELVEVEIKSKKSKPNFRLGIWRIIMQSKMTRFAAATVVIVAVMVGLNIVGGPDMASVAWADVAEKVEEIQNYVYRMRQSETNGVKKQSFEFVTEKEIIIYNSLKYGNKTESFQNGELITRSFSLRQEKEFIGICPAAKMYERHPLSDSEINEMDQMSPRKMISRFMSGDYKALGSETINGVIATGIEVDDAKVLRENPPVLESFVARLWVDEKTELPVWLELEFAPKGSAVTTKIVVDEFIWDVDFDASDFEPNIPADYASEGKRSSINVQQKQPVEATGEMEQYLSRFENLKLPDMGDWKLLGIEDNEPKMDIALVGHVEIWKTQDGFIRNWPSYLTVRAQLYAELLEKLDINNLTTEELVGTGLALRNKFWQKGGCLSKVSYPFGYAARILLEIAHDREPNDMDITDELVESILSVELVWQCVEDSDEKIKNPYYQDELTKLRLAQFEQIKKEVEAGRTPTWKDFVRINDLTILLGGAKDYESALEVIDWLILEAERGGWADYLDPIKRMQKRYSNGEKFYYNIFVNKDVDVFPEEHRYGRRLPSFQGPARQKRGLVPCHIANQKPVWTGE